MAKFVIIKTEGGSVTIDMGDVYRRAYRASTSLRPLLKQVGLILVSSSQKSFEEQKRGKQLWPERGSSGSRVKNKALVVESINKGRTPPARVFDARPALINTGHLLGSISATVENENTVSVGTTVPYATKLQNGGPINIKVNDSAIAKLIDWAQKNEVMGEMRSIIRNKKYTSRIKPRTFVSIEKEDIEDIKDATRRYFTEGAGSQQSEGE